MKKGIALAMVAMFSFGAAMVTVTGTSEASYHRDQRQEIYEDGTTNKRSHELHQEDITHDINIGALRYQLNKGEIAQKEYDLQFRKEQQRHDKAVAKIKGQSEKVSKHRK